MTLNRTHILSYALVACVLLYITENVYHPVYLVSLLQKVSSFVVIPILIGYIYGHRIAKMGEMSRTSVIYGVSLGLVSMIIIGMTYILLKESIDWSAIRASMESRHITESTFVLVFLYIMFGNSFIEEYFFRGVVFYQLVSHTRI
jgi:membrane protease YdiL (CAAX protease family)